MLPLYKSLRELYPSLAKANPALIFDKFVDIWASYDQPIGAPAKKTFLQQLPRDDADRGRQLKAHLTRRRAMVTALGGASYPVRTGWRFVSGLGASHPRESGFVWHHTLGVPYLPGSSVKGMMRAYADPEGPWQGCSDVERVKELFGTQKAEGRLIVFDALPTAVPKLEVDILNPHYSKYYQGKAPPADYLSPVPVFFLTVAPNQPFEFALAPVAPGPNAAADLQDGLKLLCEALKVLGAGAKTSSGYGRFTGPD